MQKINLVCPYCKRPLGTDESRAPLCESCGELFDVVDGIPQLFLSDRLTELKRTELDYWNHRALHEFDSLDQVERHYKSESFASNHLNLYSYSTVFDTLSKDHSVLEVGAGPITKGLYLLLFRGFSNVVMTDLSPVTMRINAEYARSKGIDTGGLYYAVDMENLPFSDCSFDVVMIHAALHHLPDPAPALQEMVRCLKPTGLLVGHLTCVLPFLDYRASWSSHWAASEGT